MRNSRAVCGILAAGLVTVGALAACSSSNRKAGSEQSQAASADSSADTAAAGGTSAAPATAPQGGMTDANIVALLDAANKADRAGGALASKKATNADVHAFAKLMMSEPHALRVRSEQLATQLGVEPKAPE